MEAERSREHEESRSLSRYHSCKKILEWQPSTDIETGIDLSIQHYKKNLI